MKNKKNCIIALILSLLIFFGTGSILLIIKKDSFVFGTIFLNTENEFENKKLFLKLENKNIKYEEIIEIKDFFSDKKFKIKNNDYKNKNIFEIKYDWNSNIKKNITVKIKLKKINMLSYLFKIIFYF